MMTGWTPLMRCEDCNSLIGHCGSNCPTKVVFKNFDRHDLLEGKTAAERKQYPLKTGCIDYFRDALLEGLPCPAGGQQAAQREGHPLQWTRGLSADHSDCLARHLACGDKEEEKALQLGAPWLIFRCI